MLKKLAALAVVVTAAALAACAGHYGSGSRHRRATLPGMPDLHVTATLPNGSPIGQLAKTFARSWQDRRSVLERDGRRIYAATYSQVFGFPPGTDTHNHQYLRKIPHTHQRTSQRSRGRRRTFRSNPTLLTSAHGTVFKKGYSFRRHQAPVSR